MTNWGQEAQTRLHTIAQLSEADVGVTRYPFTPQHKAAIDTISGWMVQAGMTVHLDAACTLVGRLDGPLDEQANTPTFLIGSHQDSVRSGGAYDGIMGVALGCLALQKLQEEGVTLPFAVEVLAFADEEGVRFPTALLGPRALAGSYNPAVLSMTDAQGITLADALNGAGGNAAALPSLKRSGNEILGYLEAHIEQGPVLQAADAAVGIVSGICGIERNTILITGTTGHAGTVPMDMRHDALVTAAHIIAHVNAAAIAATDIRATVGHITCAPNVVNAIPSDVTLTLEIRSEKDDLRQSFAANIEGFVQDLAQELGTPAKFTKTYEQAAVACDPDLTASLSQAAEGLRITAPVLVSGATHDASAMADLCPITMLFVRCKDGISHSPEEHAESADMHQAIAVMAAFLKGL